MAEAASTLEAFVPRLVREWAVEAPEERYRRIEGTLVFTDLSGFTAMSERLSRLGKLGAEELTVHLDATFSAMLRVAFHRGGSLLKFGGDALLVFFWGDDHVRRGVAAAHAMRAKLREVGNIQTEAGRFRLRMSVGINSGEFDLFLVGGSHRELVITGEAATTTVEMEGAADANEILLSPATASLLPASCRGEAKGDGGGVLLRRKPPIGADAWIPSVDVEHVDPAPFVPYGLRERLSDPQRDAEHRQVTVAFVHFVGVDGVIADAGPDEAARRIDALVAFAQERFDEAGIAFLTIDIYDDGGKIFAQAGAPISHENDEERMLRALRAIADENFGLAVRIGVNQGYVFVGEIGTEYGRTYTAMGDAVNTAARVMAKAQPGQILSTKGVLDRSRTLFETTELPPFAAKGKKKPLLAWDVGAAIGTRERRDDRQLPLIGRDEELAVLLAAAEEAKVGRGGVVQVVADAGMGKSRLVEELVARAELPTISASTGQYQHSIAYHAFGSILAGLLGGSTAEVLRERVTAEAPELIPWLPLLAIPLDVQVDPTPEVDALDPQFVKARLRTAVGDLMERLVREPSIWVIEDGHWVDEPSLELLGALAERFPRRPLLCVVTIRPEVALPLGDDGTTIRLEPLSAEAAKTLVATASPRPLLPQHVAALADRAGGNPLFLSEVASGFGGNDDLDHLPETAETLMSARLDALPARQRNLLRKLSVLGQQSDLELAAALVSMSVTDLAADAHEDFVAVDAENLHFRHALGRDAAYAGLSFRTRRELHLQAGALIESRSDDAEREAELLSLHFHEAREWARSLRYSKAAAERAEQKHAYLEAANFWRRAAEDGSLAGSDDVALAHLWQASAEAARRGGNFQYVSSALRAARRRARGRVEMLIDLAGREAVIRNLVGRGDQALRWYAEATRLLRQLPGGSGTARLHAQLSMGRAALAYEQGKLTTCVRWCNAGLVTASAAGHAEEQAKLHSMLHIAYRDLRHPDRDEAGRRALALAQESGGTRLQGQVAANLAIDAHTDGEWITATTLYRHALHALNTTGNVMGASILANNLGEILMNQGDLDGALPLFEQALETFRAAGFWYVFPVLRNLGRGEGAAGDSAKAFHLFSEAEAGLQRFGAVDQVTETLLRRAEVLLRTDRAADADALLQGLEVPDHLQALRSRLLSHVAIRQNDVAGAQRLLVASGEAATAAGDVYEMLATTSAQADLASALHEDKAPFELEADRLATQLGIIRMIELPVVLPSADVRPADGNTSFVATS